MAFSSSKTTRLLVLLQITLLVVSALIMPRYVCHGARGIGSGTNTIGGYGYGPLDPNRPACIGKCPVPGGSYEHPGGGPYKNHPGGGDGPVSYPTKPATP